MNRLSRLPPDLARVDQDMMEMFLLLPGWQARQLEQHAQRQGLTPGELARGIIASFLRYQALLHGGLRA